MMLPTSCGGMLKVKVRRSTLMKLSTQGIRKNSPVEQGNSNYGIINVYCSSIIFNRISVSFFSIV